ncbi:hypothetical protein BLNAU_2367 [Blattamonas nauphoetae]|uniref:Uncharacterized protein n=1 Tax=Blattamonas nauphoetae TaxID=2049346 RepID=A0ABQ9XRJ0_9EUKA|nr:hypothetical protein BLNAU_19871 [Blattamonas nauphoetae]KAK2946499.1 hypothetical protein BLNAU_18541 [Blattamonas nauphoetae]KAK2954499.1 hypothetical protein BLNAU_10519 [Blattamonas nauphoetae]KAK2955003.1 hypothetical protein BLNAU_10143 [Blattamonas nauphoetae]KAK2960752.1 hypothetical protein BLNAU_4149 [Blattamonas nauphoetae]
MSTVGKTHEQSQDKTLNSIGKTLIRNLRTVLFQEDCALLNSTLCVASPFCEVAHNFAGQMTKLLKRFEAINNLPAESQFQRARYLSIMISEYDANPLLQVMCYKRLRKHREKTSLRDTAATVQL